MITLTTPKQVNTVLGSSATVGYDHMVLAPFSMDPVAQTISGSVRMTASSAPRMQAILGSFSVSGATGALSITVAQLDFTRQIQLSGPQIASVLTVLGDAQNALESIMITFGVIAGTQGPGA